MTRTELEQAVYRDFGYSDSPASAISSRVRGYLNDRHRRILSRPGLDKLRRETATLTLTASTAVYGLDMPIQRLHAVSDTTNDNPLYERSLDWYRRVDPDPTTGTQQYWIPMRWSPALRDISTGSGSGVWVVSTSVSDTTQTAHIETIDANGSVTSATAALNGTTRVAVGSATNHMRLVRFALDLTTAVGAIELSDAAAAGNRVSRIVLGRTAAQHLQIALWPTPAAADVLRFDFVHWIRDFTVAYDEPQLPTDFHYLVSVGAKIDEARKKDDQRVTQWQQEYEEGLRYLQNFINNPPELLIVPGELAEVGRSNLGSAFPSGTW